jgi:TM2 domain-containing membrane protein YozV
MSEQSRGFLRDNALSLGFGGLFLATLLGQAVSGTADYNAQQIANGLEPVSFLEYVTSSSFGVDVMENWQSEYLQFFLYVFATVWLIQRGSSESKKPGEEGPESDKEQKVDRHADEDSPGWARTGGWRTAMFSRSLGLIMGALFLLTWIASSIAGWAAYNGQQLSNHEDPVSWVGYLSGADFWNRSFQNWQSEMLAVGSMAVFSVYLRQRGSPESKPVGAPHATTGATAE